MFGKKLSSSAMVLSFEDESRGVPLAKAKRRKLESFEWIAKVPRPNSYSLIYEANILPLSNRSFFADTDFPSPRQLHATIEAAFSGSGCEPEAFSITQRLQVGVGFK